MKKGLLLSVVASTMIFAGGDIAPVEPAAPAPVADCDDFYGNVGAYYQSVDGDVDVDVTDKDLFGKLNANFDVTATIGVEKELFSGVSVGAEVSGWSVISRNIAEHHRVAGAPDPTANKYDGGALTQMYLGLSLGNTAAKVGRFALPGSLSPLMRTGTTAGVKMKTFDGVLLANTDVADTTIYGAYVYAITDSGSNITTKLGLRGDEAGAFALGFQNKSIENTTITAVGYYAPELLGADQDAVAGAINVNTKLGSFDIDAQGTYVTGATSTTAAGVTTDYDAAITAGLKLGYDFGVASVWGAVSYANNGMSNPYTLAGGTGSLIGDAIDHDFSRESIAYGGGVTAPFWIGTLYAGGSMIDYEDAATPVVGDLDKTVHLKAGYLFNVAGVDMKAEYRQSIDTKFTGTGTDTVDVTDARVRLEAVYKF